MEEELLMTSRQSKKGYILIELLCTIAIMLILCSVIAISFKSYKDIKNGIEVKYVNNEMINFINSSRNYCISRNITGKMFFNSKSNCVIFHRDINSNIDTFTLPEDFKLQPVLIYDGSITIDDSGMLLNACSILYKDNKGETHIITICVGTGNVEVKE
ncbi:type II secretory pathway pseudopilin PulG [Clostridium acetobutylicum]|uniref:Prepilin peptidase n=1 Tax=Clostridium acetobutylicum (strain ATCC 824 / DSM 792 / JCM 1419 / IAM 19013 / LMG 5710 / NBRC 13948 / NRRL B-527 / VKM B-1787 / 2291 / W) TaxID=272562 RepID=Q97HB0_CLOAB|nr:MULTISPECIES: type II secretion system protein [Clostridium]AAK80061.1 Prepilin peptidase [Clostridium acetobutylicum ATCC 824]ADZ21153.1 Prepilin peptidase [Clostridium acetobutylicum EA 2018]AEI32184.1 prepilin peptidase [Clostridium acetobutylicum DSM 1731]AWV79512.1 type II secretion system protein [Clostridium acetobutylicum]MBC2394515.1 type II secretion system protein [Clostridium acetobutylicum]